MQVWVQCPPRTSTEGLELLLRQHELAATLHVVYRYLIELCQLLSEHVDCRHQLRVLGHQCLQIILKRFNPLRLSLPVLDNCNTITRAPTVGLHVDEGHTRGLPGNLGHCLWLLFENC